MTGRRSKVESGALDVSRLTPHCTPQETQNPGRENVLKAFCHLHSYAVARWLSIRDRIFKTKTDIPRHVANGRFVRRAAIHGQLWEIDENLIRSELTLTQ